MSRTKKGAKGSGYEYWAGRPGDEKKQTHRLERIEGKNEVREELKELQIAIPDKDFQEALNASIAKYDSTLEKLK